MPIVDTDIVLRLSTTAGAAGDTTASSASASLGKYVSTTVWAPGANTLFDDVSGTENAASESEYRCVFVLNNHATLSMTLATVAVTAEVAGGAAVAIGLDPTATSAKGSAGAQAVTVANEDTAPAGVTFSTPTTDGTGLALGTIAPGQVKAIWVRRTTANNAAINGDGFTLGIFTDTAA